MSEGNKFVAVGLMTEADMTSWGHKLRHIYRAETTPDFDDLLSAIDRADLNKKVPSRNLEHSEDTTIISEVG